MNIRITEKEIEELKGINEFWGDQMPMMAMEEAGEFIQAISKMERILRNQDDPDWGYLVGAAESKLIAEMGDVLISIGVLMNRYGISISDIMSRIDRKLEKEY